MTDMDRKPVDPAEGKLGVLLVGLGAVEYCQHENARTRLMS